MLLHALYRAIYLALLAEGPTPILNTVTAIGIISVIGFTRDIFMGPWMGYLLDRSPGAPGHQHVFLLVAAFAVMGLCASLLFQKTSMANVREASAV